MKIRPVGAELFNADDQTQRDGRTKRQKNRNDEANNRFSLFFYPSENEIQYPKLKKNKLTMASKIN